MDPEEMFAAVMDSYQKVMKSQEIAKQESAAEMHHMHSEMEEMQAWDSYALRAFDAGVGSIHKDLASKAADCAAFANELLKQRRATFLIGNEE
jgi:hypothetical protein